ncbi:MAG: hypothetical protein KDD01_03995 [Phaeodactylibacter sp.]|nr:hypothetical protein [Phaeodactylibacter sp.]
MKTLFTLALLAFPFLLPAQNLTVSTITEEFDASGGVKLGPDGHLYIGNFGASLSQGSGSQVWQLNLETLELEVFATGLVGASGNAFDSQGNFFQSNIGGSSISRITPDGQVSTFVSQGISAPVGIAIDEQDNLYVCNCGGPFANTIRKVTPEGVSTQFAGGNIFSCPNGITIDQEGNLYVSNFNNSNVIRVTPEGQASIFAIVPGGNNGHLTYFEPFNTLFINSHGSSSVYKMSLADRIVSRIAGNGLRGNSDGPADQATFSRPNGVALSATGDTLYLNSSIPTVDNPGSNFFPLNPSVIRMITGIRELFTSADRIEAPGSWQARLFPNPSDGNLNLELELNEKDDLQISVLDSTGKQVYSEEWGQLSSGLQRKELKLDGLPAGHFYLLISSPVQALTLSFQLVK